MLTLSGCSSPALTASPLPAQRQPTTTQVILPTITALPLTPTAILPQGAEIIQQCLMANDTPVVLKEITIGTILEDRALWDVQTGKRYKLPSTSDIAIDRFGLQVSPKRNSFAYVESIKNDQQILWVVNAHAETLTKILFAGKGLEQPRWLDDERLILYTAQTDVDGSELVVNPFTGEQTLLSNKLPGLILGIRGATIITWDLEYSPDLTKAVYLDVANDKIVPILQDISADKTLWQSSGFFDQRGKPVWSPDGQQVAVNSGRWLYLVNSSGEIQPVIKVDHQLEREVEGMLHVGAFAEIPAWSSNGVKLAFWYRNSLATYDLKSREALDLCSKIEWDAPRYSPRWSPDSKQIILYEHDSQTYRSPLVRPVLLDLEKNIVYTHLSETQNINPDVWMNSLP